MIPDLIRRSPIYPSLVCLLFGMHGFLSLVSGQRPRGTPTQPTVNQLAEFKQKLLAPALKMLEAKGVPFNPKLLLDENWRTLLEPTLAGMPEMDQTLHVTEPMFGVYLAGLVTLPRRITLEGDTVIFTR